MTTVVYIGDADQDLCAQIVENLDREVFRIEIISDRKTLLKKIRMSIPDILLMNDEFLRRNQRPERLFHEIPTVVYATQMEIDDRLNYYKRGVRRVVVDSQNLGLKVSSVTRMLQFRLNELRNFRQKSLTYGSIQGLFVHEILQNAFWERKNFVIQIQNKDWKAKIRTFQGHVVNAFTSNLTGVEATLKALLLPSGTFLIRKYRKMDEYSPISSSTFAMLAEAQFERTKIRNFLDKFHITNPNFKVEAGNQVRNLSREEQKIVEIIARYPAFQEILMRSPFSALKTLYILQKLYDNSLIQSEDGADSGSTIHENDIVFLRETLFPEDVREGKLIVFGLPSSGKTEFIRTIAGLKKASIKSVQSVDFTRIHLNREVKLIIFGLSIEESFQPLLDKLSEGMLACIFLIDYNRKDKFNYTKYLLHQVLQTYPVFFVVGVTNIPKDTRTAIQEIRKALEIPQDIEIVPLQVDSFSQIRQLLRKFRKVSEFSRGR